MTDFLIGFTVFILFDVLNLWEDLELAVVFNVVDVVVHLVQFLLDDEHSFEVRFRIWYCEFVSFDLSIEMMLYFDVLYILQSWYVRLELLLFLAELLSSFNLVVCDIELELSFYYTPVHAWLFEDRLQRSDFGRLGLGFYVFLDNFLVVSIHDFCPFAWLSFFRLLFLETFDDFNQFFFWKVFEIFFIHSFLSYSI